MITNLSMIDTNRMEGRLLMAALAKLTSESQTDKSPDEVIEQCNGLLPSMFHEPLPDDQVYVKPSFQDALSNLINSYSKENDSDTPDFILAKYMEQSLMALCDAVTGRDKYYGFDPKI